MDYIKIGNFITNERKAKNLTQAKLAEKIFVSEKTVSKWENGNGIPDTNSLVKLCEIFDVSLNELLSGERIAMDNKEKNEKLLYDMAKELEQRNKMLWASMWIIMIASFVALIASVFLCEHLIPEGVWKTITMLIIVIVFLAPCCYAVKLEVSVGTYKCKKCGCEVVPTYQEAVMAMHMGMTRYLKCPNCKKRTWCKKVIKK